jgi:hypothetical protein
MTAMRAAGEEGPRAPQMIRGALFGGGRYPSGGAGTVLFLPSLRPPFDRFEPIVVIAVVSAARVRSGGL